MTRHDLPNIHPATTSWQETTVHAIDGTDAAAPDQNGGSTHRLCCAFRTECPPLGRYAAHTTDGRGNQRNGADPKSP